MTTDAMPQLRRSPAATPVGLIIALLLPLLTSPLVTHLLGTEPSSALFTGGLVIHWITFALLLVIVLLWEHEPLRSIGWQTPRFTTLLAGIVAGILITAASAFVVQRLGLSPDTHLVTFAQSLPMATRVILVITAGVFEETMYRGYGIERLSPYVGGKWVAAAITLALFTLAHLWAVGAAHLPPILIVGSLVTLLYLWRRDLLLNMLAHATIDAIALLVIPALR
jgi:membrane protease YdiL (CAAX protease family)